MPPVVGWAYSGGEFVTPEQTPSPRPLSKEGEGSFSRMGCEPLPGLCVLSKEVSRKAIFILDAAQLAADDGGRGKMGRFGSPTSPSPKEVH